MKKGIMIVAATVAVFLGGAAFMQYVDPLQYLSGGGVESSCGDFDRLVTAVERASEEGGAQPEYFVSFHRFVVEDRLTVSSVEYTGQYSVGLRVSVAGVQHEYNLDRPRLTHATADEAACAAAAYLEDTLGVDAASSDRAPFIQRQIERALTRAEARGHNMVAWVMNGEAFEGAWGESRMEVFTYPSTG